MKSLFQMLLRKARCLVNKTANIIIALFCTVTLWLLFQVTTYASFQVPSGSMEPTLVAGDYVLVNKWIMGGRVFNVLDALDGKKVSIRRLPGWRKAERGDVLVFNFPYPNGLRDSLYMDVMLYYIKRCIALPGDTLEISNSHYYVHGRSGDASEGVLGNAESQDRLHEILYFETPEVLRALGVKTDGLWDSSELGGDLDNLLPVVVPCRGVELEMTRRSTLLYRRLIEWETNSKLTLDSVGNVYLDGNSLRFYRFQKDYYFMAGDNAVHSNDSRYWGLVPEEFIVGVATHIWKSENPRSGKLYWDRVMKRIY